MDEGAIVSTIMADIGIITNVVFVAYKKNNTVGRRISSVVTNNVTFQPLAPINIPEIKITGTKNVDNSSIINPSATSISD